MRNTFTYPKERLEKRTFGSKGAKKILRPNGDWRDYLPPDEDQNRHGVESYACYVESQQAGRAVIREEEYGIPDLNYSARFNALLSGGNEGGGDPLAAAESIKTDGMVIEGMMPFSEDIKSWQDYHSWKGASERLCRIAGKMHLAHWKEDEDVVFTKDEPREVKYAKLKDALKRSPIPMSVCGVFWTEQNGVYKKPVGAVDTHMVLCLYVDEQNRPHWRDTYKPYYKIGEPFYNSEFAMELSTEKIEEKKKLTFWEMILNIWQKIIRSIS